MGRMDSWMNGWKNNASSWGHYWCPVIKNVFKTKRLEFNLKLNTNKVSLNNLRVQNTEEKHSTQLFYSLTVHEHTVLIRNELFRPSSLGCIWCFGLLSGWLVDFDSGEVIDRLPECPVDWYTSQLTGCMLASLNGSHMFDWLTTCVSEQLVNTLVLFCFKCFQMVTHQFFYQLKWVLSNLCAADTTVNF